MDNIIEKCVRYKIRFPIKGQNSVEEMFDLTTEQLSELHSALDATKNVRTGASLSKKKSREEVELEMKMEALRYIYDLKVAEAAQNEAALLAAQEKAREKTFWEGILAQKKQESASQLTIEEIEARIASLSSG